MPTEITKLKNTTPAGDYDSTDELIIGKNNIYQLRFLVVAGSLLALLVLTVIAGNNGGRYLDSATDVLGLQPKPKGLQIDRNFGAPTCEAPGGCPFRSVINSPPYNEKNHYYIGCCCDCFDCYPCV